MATTTRERRGMMEGEVRELVDGMLREAFRAQFRELEKHLIDIHDRLQKLEGVKR
jgi:hypothetical protein